MLDSLSSEHELVKNIAHELSNIKLCNTTAPKKPSRTRKSVRPATKASRAPESSGEKENKNTNPEEVAKGLADEYNEENEDEEVPEPDPYVPRDL